MTRRFLKPTLVTITAPTASGKNYLRDGLERELGWSRIVSTTTRAPRVGEVNGEDYEFITHERSLEIEARCQFAELIEFRGVRYGVTEAEMAMKLRAPVAPMIILEPQGLEVYKKLCAQKGWDLFSIFVHTPEAERIRRLNVRTSADVALTIGRTLVPAVIASISTIDDEAENQALKKIYDDAERLVQIHSDRLLSLAGDERSWITRQLWDAIVPGDDFDTALQMIQQGISWRNRLREEPKPYDHSTHPNAVGTAS